MKNNNENKIKYVITNEKTMRKNIIPNGCIVCKSLEKETNPNAFEFNEVVMCRNCGAIYVPQDNSRLVNEVINSGKSFIVSLTDGVLQDDLGTTVVYTAFTPKGRKLKPENDAPKLHSTK